MGLNLVESFIVAGAAELLSRRRIISPLECTRAEDDALDVVAAGMKKAGYHYNPGLLASPWGNFYEGLAGVRYLQERDA